MVLPDRNYFLPTKEACEDFNFRRMHSSYDMLNPDGSGKGFFGGALERLAQLSQNAVGAPIFDVNGPGEDQKTFLGGPQFRNKPGNLAQDVASRFTLGIYNGPESAFWNAKRKQEIRDSADLDQLRSTNSVNLVAVGNQPYTLETQSRTVNGEEILVPRYRTQSGEGPQELWKMNILPNWNHEEGLEFSHEHEWGRSDDIFTSILSTVGEIAAGAAQLTKRFDQLIGGSVGDAAGIDANSAGALPIIKTDIADTYQSTNKITLDIPFTLFTRNNFYRDVFGPIMLMNYLSFPRRSSLDEAIEKLAPALRDVTAGIMNQIGNRPTSDGVDAVSREDLEGTSGSEINNFLNAVIPGFRIFSAFPPSYFNIEHTAGLFSFKNCVITNFRYKYMGPWVTTTNHPQDQKLGQSDAFSGTAGGIPVRGKNKNWWEFWRTENDILDSVWTGVKLTYPVKAECVLSLKTLDPVFAEDWFVMLQQYRNIRNGDQNNPNPTTSINDVNAGNDILNLGGLI